MVIPGFTDCRVLGLLGFRVEASNMAVPGFVQGCVRW